jgi:hypothetical protein
VVIQEDESDGAKMLGINNAHAMQPNLLRCLVQEKVTSVLTHTDVVASSQGSIRRSPPQ